MKIIITVNTYYPLKDGVQFVTQYHAENLAKRGHDVIVMTTNHGSSSEEIHNGVKIIRFNIMTKHTFYIGEKKEYIECLLKNLENADALINVCTQQPLTDWCFPLLKQIKCKKILYMHGMYDKKYNFRNMTSIADFGHKVWNNIRWGLYYKINKKTFKNYDNVIQLHKFDTAYIYFKKHYNIESDIIENAVDDSFFENKERKEKYAISVANYMARKNQEFLLKSFYKCKLNNEFGLVLIGSEENNYYKKLIKLKEDLDDKYGERNIKILTKISRKETIKMIKKSYIYLLGSKWEAFPISIIESMASSVPFISTDVGIVRYLPGGIIVRNENEMSYWIENLLNNDYLREIYGRLGNSYASNHMMIEKKVDDLEKIVVG